MPAAFRSVLESDKPTSIAAIPESNAFLVHCESKLFSYHLDSIIRVSQGDAEPKKNIDWETRLARDSGDVLFFKAGCIVNQTWSERLCHMLGFGYFSSTEVVYSAKNSKQVTSHVLEVTRQDQDPQYRPLGSVRHHVFCGVCPLIISATANVYPRRPPRRNLSFQRGGDLHVQSYLCRGADEVSPFFIHRRSGVDHPRSTTTGCRFREVVPKFPNSKPSTNTFRRVLKGMQSLFRTKKSDTLKVLGSVESGKNTLIIYDGEYFSPCMFVV